MKKFKFRYQTLLEVRERRKKSEEERYQQLAAALQAEEAQLQSLQQEEAVQREAWMAMQVDGAIDLQQMLLFQEYFQRMEQRQRDQQAQIDQARERLLAQREVLSVAMRELEAIAKLKERDERAWREAIERAENELIDEMATMRHARRAHQE